MGKYPLRVGIFNLQGKLISKFENNVELAKHLKIAKVTVRRHINYNIMITIIILDL